MHGNKFVERLVTVLVCTWEHGDWLLKADTLALRNNGPSHSVQTQQIS